MSTPPRTGRADPGRPESKVTIPKLGVEGRAVGLNASGGASAFWNSCEPPSDALKKLLRLLMEERMLWSRQAIGCPSTTSMLGK